MDAFLICFSIIDRNTFENVRAKWWEETKKYPGFDKNKTFLTIGLKSDLAESYASTNPAFRADLVTLRREVNEFNKLLGGQRYIETSATTGEGIDGAITVCIRTKVSPQNSLTDKASKKIADTGNDIKSKLGIRF